MQTATIQLESYQIPQFYRILNSLGVCQLPPHSDFEVYRGQFDGGQVVIFHSGRVSYPASPKFEHIISQAVHDVRVNEQKRRNLYAILAKPSTSNQPFSSDHLNIWLTIDQYYQAIEFFSSHPKVNQVRPKFDFEEKVFEQNGHILRFHTNGKVISEYGFSQFAPSLRQIIQSNVPFHEYDLVIGQDEVGNGEKIGPLVVSSVAATPQQMIDLQLAGIKDGKMVPHKITLIMSPWVRDLATGSNVWKLDPEVYNKTILEKSYNIKDILTWGHTRAFYGMLHQLKPLKPRFEKILLLVDQFDKYRVLQKLEKDPSVPVDISYLPHAEKRSTSVAAASVLSKASRYRWIQMSENKYQVKLKRRNLKHLVTHPQSHKLLKAI